MANEFALEIVTPDKFFYQGEAEMIIVRTTEGDRGILKNHRPLVTGLATGTLRIKKNGKSRATAWDFRYVFIFWNSRIRFGCLRFSVLPWEI